MKRLSLVLLLLITISWTQDIVYPLDPNIRIADSKVQAKMILYGINIYHHPVKKIV